MIIFNYILATSANDLIHLGQQALDEIENDEAYDPQVDMCHNFCTDSAQRRVEARRSLNFPGIHDPIDEPIEEENTEAGPSKENKRSESKPSESESFTLKENVSKENTNNNNANTQVASPELEPGYMYDIDIYRSNGQVITVGAPYVSPTGHSSPSSTKSSPSPPTQVENTGKIPRSQSSKGFITTRKRTRSSSLKKTSAKRPSRKWTAQELLDFSFRSDNARGTIFF